MKQWNERGVAQNWSKLKRSGTNLWFAKLHRVNTLAQKWHWSCVVKPLNTPTKVPAHFDVIDRGTIDKAELRLQLQLIQPLIDWEWVESFSTASGAQLYEKIVAGFRRSAQRDLMLNKLTSPLFLAIENINQTNYIDHACDIKIT